NYCQLGKLAVVTRYSRFDGNEGNRTSFIESATASRPLRSQDWLVRQIPGERIGKVAGEITAADFRAAAVNNRRGNAIRRPQPGQLSLGQWQTLRPWTVFTVGQDVDDRFTR